MGSVNAVARVQIGVEVMESAWGDDCSIGQLYKQAGEMAKSRVMTMIGKGGGKVIGEPKITGILTERA